jgi:ankyrin repeat protein
MDLQQRVLLAVEDGDVSVLKELVASEEKLLKLLSWTDHDGDMIVHVLARCGNNDAISLLLAQPPLSEMHGINARRSGFLNATNSLQETPMLIALGAGNFTTASLLLQSGADPWLQNYNRESSFYMACYTGAIEVVTRILQSKSCSPVLIKAASADGLSGMDCARTRGYPDVVDAIKEHLSAEAKRKLKEAAERAAQ